MTLTFADQSVKRPIGIAEDIIVQVGKFMVPCDFVIFDMEEEGEILLILGRPFLATVGIEFDFQNSLVKVMVNVKQITFDCSKEGKYLCEVYQL